MIKNFINNILKASALELINCSYWVLLFTCMIAIILYIAGQKKAGKYISISFTLNFLLQALKLGLK